MLRVPIISPASTLGLVRSCEARIYSASCGLPAQLFPKFEHSPSFGVLPSLIRHSQRTCASLGMLCKPGRRFIRVAGRQRREIRADDPVFRAIFLISFSPGALAARRVGAGCNSILVVPVHVWSVSSRSLTERMTS